MLRPQMGPMFKFTNRWYWSPRFHKDYKLSILSVNDKIIPYHFYIACFFLRIRDKIFLAPSAKKNWEGTSISQLWDKESHFICSKYMTNNRRNSTPTSYFRELTWPSDWKKHKWKTNNTKLPSIFCVRGPVRGGRLSCSLLVERGGSYKGRDWERRMTLNTCSLKSPEQLFPNLVSNPSKALPS